MERTSIEQRLSKLEDKLHDVNGRLIEVEHFIEMSPPADKHHDDHIYVGESRDRIKAFLNSAMEHGAKIIVYAILVGLGILLTSGKIRSTLGLGG